MRTSTLVNEGTLRSTAVFSSTLSNVNKVKISDLLEFLVMLLFSSLFSQTKTICRKLQDMKKSMGEFFFDRISFHFHLQLCKNILEWLLSYEVTSFNL